MAQVPTTDVTTISVGGSAYTIPFLYQNRAEVFVEVDGVDTAFTWINSGNINITPAPAAGAKVRRYRSTTAFSIRHDFRNGVPFTPKNITENNDQLLYAVQEAVNDTAVTAARALATAEESLERVQASFDILSERTQYIVLGPYGPGLNFQTTSQVFSYMGEFYAPGPAITLPYTTTGVGAAEIANFRSVGDAVLRQEFITDAITLHVPSAYATISAAFAYLNGRTIAGDAVVTIKVADGTHNLTSSIIANHPQGERIRLIGNEANPAACVIMGASPAVFDGLVVSGGHVLGYVNGFKFDLPAKAEMPNNTTGIMAVQNSTITCGSSILVNNWFYGIAARDGSYIYCPNAQVNAAGDVGIWAFCGSTIVCNGAKSTNANAAGNPWGFGFQAEFGSVLVGTGIEASGCKIGGIASLSNSTCRVEASYTHNNIGSGYFVRDTAIIEAGGGITANNAGYGLEVLNGQGQITGLASNVGNALGGANAFPYTTTSAGQGRLTTSAGPLRIDTSDASSVFFHTAGGLQAEVAHTPNASSRVKLSGSSNDFPSVAAEGGSGNISLEVVAKGSGSVNLRTGGGRQLEVYNTANAVNFPVITGSVAGSAPIVGVSGSDANIDLRLNCKGTGRVHIGPHNTNADAPITGYIEVKDSSGILRKLAVIA